MSKALTAVIIDDMDLARKSLKKDLEKFCSEVSIIGEAHSVVTGSKLLKSMVPDILFLDIQLDDGEGFDILELMDDMDTHIIFTTASDAHALKAFQFSAVDYLLKPIDPELLVKAVEKVKLKSFSLDSSYRTLSSNIKKLDKLVLHTAEQVKVAELSDIIRLESMGNYTYFYFSDGSKLLITKTLKDYSTLLSENYFLRVHQSHLINLGHLKAYVKVDGGHLEMSDGSRVPVSVRKKASVMESIEAYGSS